MKKRYNRLSALLCFCMMLSLVMTIQACSDKDNKDNNGQLLLDAEQTSYTLSPDGESCSIGFMATTSWEATLSTDHLSATKSEASAWLTLDKNKGIGGKVNVLLVVAINDTDVDRNIVFIYVFVYYANDISLAQAGNSLQ